MKRHPNWPSITPEVKYYSATRKTPSRSPSVVADVGIPLIVSVVFGLVFLVVSLYFVRIYWAILPAIVAFVAAFLPGLIFTHKSMFMVESFDIEMKHDTPGGNVQTQPLQLTSRIENGNHVRTLMGSIPAEIGAERFVNWAESVVSGKSMGVRQWAGSGKLFTAEEYKMLMTTMREMEVVTVGDGQKGYHFMPGGKEQLTQWLQG